MIVNQIKDNYTQIPNEIITSDISDKAKIIFCYLASRPTGWNFYNVDIMQKLKIKRKETIADKFKELIDGGWISRERVTKEIAIEKNLTPGTYIYTIYSSPKMQKTESTKKPYLGKNRTHSNTNLLSNTELNNNPPYRLVSKEEEKEQEKRVLADFNLFYSEYPKKKAKDAALKAFKKRYKELPPINELVEIVKLHKRTEDWKKEKGQFIPNPSTWINQGRWEDEIKLPEEDSIYEAYPWLKDIPEG